MTKSIKNFIACILIVSSSQINGQNSYFEKTVNLPTGQITLKTALNSLSKQSGCVFSYDPTKIIDNQQINISQKGSSNLRAALTLILPKDVQFKLNGKYVVLQKMAVKNIMAPELTKKQISIPKIPRLKAKEEGRINEDVNHERLVLPPPADNTVLVAVSPKSEVLEKQGVDSTSIVQKTNNTQSIDTLPAISAKTAPDSAKTVPASEPPITQDKTEPKKADAVKNENPSFGNFMRKNGFLESALSLNRKLGALSLRSGLYNIYSILSIGSDYNKSYHLGIGAGFNVKINNYFGINLDLIRNSLIGGRSYLIGVRATNTQLTPALNYAIGNSFKIFAGPSFYLIKSRYKNGTSTDTDLGKKSGIGLSLGVKVDLNPADRKKI